MKINLIELLNSSSISNPLYLAYKNGTNYFSDFKKKFDEEKYYESATDLTILFHMLNLKHT